MSNVGEDERSQGVSYLDDDERKLCIQTCLATASSLRKLR